MKCLGMLNEFFLFKLNSLYGFKWRQYVNEKLLIFELAKLIGHHYTSTDIKRLENW